MTMAAQDGMAEKQKAEQLIESVPKMAEIEGVSVQLATDSAGDPSLFITFSLRPGSVVNDTFASSFVDYVAEIQSKILQSGVSRFPYTRLGRAA